MSPLAEPFFSQHYEKGFFQIQQIVPNSCIKHYVLYRKVAYKKILEYPMKIYHNLMKQNRISLIENSRKL